MWTTLLIGGLLLILAIQLYYWLQSRATIPSLHTRRILITGCDTGFGRRLALRLDKMGCHVFAACLTSSGADQLSKETSERMKTLLMDVTKDDDIERAVKVVEENIPDDKGLWALVNNAGVMGSFGMAEMMTRKEFLVPLEVNLLGLSQVTQHFLHLVRKGQGRIVNMTSAAARFAFGPCPYIASKFAAVGYTDVLRRELYHHGITVHAIEPGGYNTNILDNEAALNSMTRVFEASSPYVQSVYGHDSIQNFMANMVIHKRHLIGTNLEEVVDAYVHALTSKRPSLYYSVGIDARFVFPLLRILPSSFTDWAVAYSYSRL